MPGKSDRQRGDIYQEITDRIVDAIEAGVTEYEMPWHRTVGGIPTNARTGNAYTGVNVLSLWIAAERKGYGASAWATYKQWQDLEAHVRRGEKGSPIIFYKETVREVEEPRTGAMTEEAGYVARASWVFNADQVEGYIDPADGSPSESLVEIIEGAETFVAGTGADIRHGGQRAFYTPVSDHIQMPDQGRFVGTESSSPTEAYYATLFHELAHWTGHPKRLDRELGPRFGKRAYAMEELVAELGATFLCGQLAVTNVPRPDHAAYVGHWLEVLKADKKAVFTASARAREAMAYLQPPS